MPLLTRLARTTDDYRALKAGIAIVSAAGALTPLAASAQQVANSPTPAAAVQPASRPIPKEQCDILFDVAVEKLEAIGELVTQSAKTGMRNFFVNAATGKIDCSGERQWPW